MRGQRPSGPFALQRVLSSLSLCNPTNNMLWKEASPRDGLRAGVHSRGTLCFTRVFFHLIALDSSIPSRAAADLLLLFVHLKASETFAFVCESGGDFSEKLTWLFVSLVSVAGSVGRFALHLFIIINKVRLSVSSLNKE